MSPFLIEYMLIELEQCSFNSYQLSGYMKFDYDYAH